MTEERTTPLRERMIEDMRIRGMGEKAHIGAIKGFAAFLKRSPDTAAPDDLRAYQLPMTDAGITPTTFNARIVALRFFFGMTCGREEMKRCMQFRSQPRKLPVVFSVEEVSDLRMAAPGPGLKYRAALSISYGAGLWAAEVCSLKIGDIDSDCMLIHVDQGKGRKDRKVCSRPGCSSCSAPGGARTGRTPGCSPLPVRRMPAFAERGQAKDRAAVAAAAEPGVHCGQADGGHQQAGHAAHAPPQLRHPPLGGRHRRSRHPGPARPRQAEHHGALHACRHDDDPEHGEPLQGAGDAAGSHDEARPGVTVGGVAPLSSIAMQSTAGQRPKTGDRRHLP